MCNYDTPVSYPMSSAETAQAAEIQRQQAELARATSNARQMQGVGTLQHYSRNESSWHQPMERLAGELHHRIDHLVNMYEIDRPTVCQLIQTLNNQLEQWERDYVRSLQNRDHPIGSQFTLNPY